MAMIKCSECGQDISDKATSCIHCGCPIEKKITCNECGKEIENMDICCPNCGCPIEKTNTGIGFGQAIGDKTSDYSHYGNTLRKKINISFNQLIVIGLIVLVILGIFFFLNNKSSGIVGRYISPAKDPIPGSLIKNTEDGIIEFFADGTCLYQPDGLDFYFNCTYQVLSGNTIRIEYTEKLVLEDKETELGSTTLTIIDKNTLEAKNGDLYYKEK